MSKPWEKFCKPKTGFIIRVAGGVLLFCVIGAYLYLSSVKEEQLTQYEGKIQTLSLNEILADHELVEYAKHTSQKLFIVHCAGCHGENGNGDKTADGLFAPVLSDRDWLFEGKIETIHDAISEGLQGNMPAYRKKLSVQQITSVAKYVQALSEGQPEREIEGKAIFFSKGCAPCHGESGKGIPQIGGANLADKIWRFDGTLEGIKRTITYGINSGEQHDRISVMPKFKDSGKLTSNEIKKLAIYAQSLSLEGQEQSHK
ncbi:MAG: c-type cytochrome [Gallionella sp.]|nr:c-type cytochrome [Gallionella sp.]MDD4959022.1 c-type cytochrome [Gallionella sp.]